MAKFYFAIVLAFSITVSSRAAPPKNVDDFVSATWNTNGQKWEQVFGLMDHETFGIDVLGIPEAGTLGDLFKKKSQQKRVLEKVDLEDLTLDNFEITELNLGVTQCKVTVAARNEAQPSTSRGQPRRDGPKILYLYYYDFQVEGNEAVRHRKQNMAILSNRKAEEVLMSPCITNQGRIPVGETQASAECNDRNFINRPVLGIRVENSAFFVIHAEPTNKRNEANELITEVKALMQNGCKSCSWIMMGDWNREPEDIDRRLNPDIKIFRPRQPTKRKVGQRVGEDRELDYAVCPSSAPDMDAEIVTIRTRSDHVPVKFTKSQVQVVTSPPKKKQRRQ